jgi:hypothetical protein
VFGNFTSLKSRIALQVARKIAPCNMALRDPAINVNDSNVREQVLENIVHPGCNWSYVDESNVEFVGSLCVTDQKLREKERNTRGHSSEKKKEYLPKVLA